jgi:hypothetical protein
VIQATHRAPRIAFDEATHSYQLDGKRVPSVTQVLDPLNDWSRIPAVDLECKRALGSDVHLACNLLVRGDLDRNSLDSLVKPYVDAAEKFLTEHPGTVIASECRVASAALGVAGTIDLLMYHQQMMWYVDWKITETVPSTVGPQLAAYEVLHLTSIDPSFRHWHTRPRAKRFCVRLSPGGYRLDYQNDFRRDWADFLSCLNVWKHRESKYG